MKHLLTKLLIVLYCVLCVLSPDSAGQKNSKSSSQIVEELVALENEWLSTYLSGDRTKFDRLVAEDFTGTDESATLRDKADEKALLLPAKIPGGSAVNEDVRVRVYPNFAVVTGRIVTKFSADGREIVGFETRFTDTWAKRDGGWKVVARHYSRYPPKPTARDVKPEMLSELTGNYEIAPRVVYTISIETRKLFGGAGGQPKLELLAESEFVFFTTTPPALYVFVRDRAGKIGHLLFIQDGRVTAAKRL